MSINLEKIDLLKERANVTYKEAKEALEKCEGDLVEALIWLEEAEKIKDAEQRSAEQARDTGRQRQENSRRRQDFGRKIEDGVKEDSQHAL